MVYLVYNVTNDYINGIYEDEHEAHEASRMLEGFEVKEVPFYKNETSKVTYTEEDSNIDEDYYLNEIDSLKKELLFHKQQESISNYNTFKHIVIMVNMIIFMCMIINIAASIVSN